MLGTTIWLSLRAMKGRPRDFSLNEFDDQRSFQFDKDGILPEALLRSLRVNFSALVPASDTDTYRR